MGVCFSKPKMSEPRDLTLHVFSVLCNMHNELVEIHKKLEEDVYTRKIKEALELIDDENIKEDIVQYIIYQASQNHL